MKVFNLKSIAVATLVMFILGCNVFGETDKYIIKKNSVMEIKILESESSDYYWEQEIEDSEIIELIDVTTIKNPKEKEVELGADQLRVFRIRGAEKGSTNIRFKLKKKGEQTEPKKIRNVEIIVE